MPKTRPRKRGRRRSQRAVGNRAQHTACDRPAAGRLASGHRRTIGQPLADTARTTDGRAAGTRRRTRASQTQPRPGYKARPWSRRSGWG